MEKNFSIKKALLFSAQTIINHFFIFLCIALFYLFIFVIPFLCGLLILPRFFSPALKMTLAYEFGGAPQGIERANRDFWGAWNLLSGITYDPYLIFFLISIFLAWFLIAIFLKLGLIKIILNIYGRKSVHFSLLFSQYPLIIKGFFASLLYYVIGLIGLMLFIIPGIIFFIRFGFYLYYLVDTQCSITDSFKKSWHLTSGVTLKLIIACGVVAFISIFVFKLVILSLLVEDLVFVYLYRTLRQLKGERNNRKGKTRSISS